ncbi:hypothetical protein [Chryseobacterium chendengshani]|uniref:hypothetical protein n=1 Tax=Chryseobacterium sp. LJ756 TaxID=2864113 RepID=UPI001C63C8BF|nr:hypothetical protein [Chryseobacterium sp. LJ756]MBW7674162.1 hypothetical protein [Chryseobacterium sp. LJ756]
MQYLKRLIWKNDRIISVVNDLLQITNGRIDGFGKAEGKVWEKYPYMRALEETNRGAYYNRDYVYKKRI